MNNSEGMGFWNPESRVMIFLDRCTALVLTNFLWILCCIPIVTAGAATRAMYANLRAYSNDEAWGPGAFFRAFRQDFLRSCGIGVGLMLTAVLLTAAAVLILSTGLPGSMLIVGLVGSVGLITLLFGSMVFPIMTGPAMPLQQLILTAMTLSIGYLPRMLLVSALNLLPGFLLLFCTPVFVQISALWALVGFSLIAAINLRLMRPILRSLS